MSDFDTLLAESIEQGKVHGVLCKCVDRNGDNESLSS